jgi:hypothetical protein
MWQIHKSIIRNNYIDSVDGHPIDYENDKLKHKMNCDPPLYIINELAIAAKIKQQKYAQRLEILKGFSSQIWIPIIISFFHLLINTFVN